MTMPSLRAALALALGLAACDQNLAPPPPGNARPAAAAQKVAAPPAPSAELFKVPVDDSPGRGGAEPKVTVVAFSEFQCPFCSRVEPTLTQVLQTYGDDVRVVWKHRPLPFHERAMPAALAAEAAAAQGKFWPMHAALFAHQGALADEDILRYAGDIGLDVPAFKAALAAGTGRARIDADRKLADALAAKGTPTFFINGRRFVGARPFAQFQALIDEEMARANAKLAAGVSRGRLYAALTESGLTQAPPSADDSARPPTCENCGGKVGGKPSPVPDNETVYKIDLGASPSRGPKDAPITLVVFSDFQCPFCGKVEATVAALEQAYPGKLRVVWKNFPLEFHGNARPAAAAAMAAATEGKFWPMHAKLFANQQALDRASLVKYAGELGLDVGRFEAGLDAAAASVEADAKQGSSLGVTGTPTVFVNGRRVTGAQPPAAFKALIDEELRKRGG
jgi:protein-disulfide isomerase